MRIVYNESIFDQIAIAIADAKDRQRDIHSVELNIYEFNSLVSYIKEHYADSLYKFRMRKYELYISDVRVRLEGVP